MCVDCRCSEQSTLAPPSVTAEGQFTRFVPVMEGLLEKNNRQAHINRQLWKLRQHFVLNLVSSPGAGKTTLLVRSIERLRSKLPLAVIEGDQQTRRDADRIQSTGVPVEQINTGKGCHLDAQMLATAYQNLEKCGNFVKGLLFIENVGNLVCPAGFDLGENHKVVMLSVAEGEDKPLKYPDMFAAAELMLLTKTDLSEVLGFDTEQCLQYARQVNPKLQILQVSSRSDQGMDEWLSWLMQHYHANLLPSSI